jgi:uncharacterized protein YfaP (DUF2135 family)
VGLRRRVEQRRDPESRRRGAPSRAVLRGPRRQDPCTAPRDRRLGRRPILPTGGGLDVDSVDGGGPEIFSLAAPVRGTYLVYVNYWGNFDAAGYNFEDTRRERSLITATIAVITNENTVHEKRETYVVPLRKIGDLVFVRALRY